MNFHGYLILRGGARGDNAVGRFFDPWTGPLSTRFAATFVLVAGVGVTLFTRGAAGGRARPRPPLDARPPGPHAVRRWAAVRHDLAGHDPALLRRDVRPRRRPVHAAHPLDRSPRRGRRARRRRRSPGGGSSGRLDGDPHVALRARRRARRGPCCSTSPSTAPIRCCRGWRSSAPASCSAGSCRRTGGAPRRSAGADAVRPGGDGLGVRSATETAGAVLASTDPFDRGLAYTASALGTALVAFGVISWLADRFAGARRSSCCATPGR